MRFSTLTKALIASILLGIAVSVGYAQIVSAGVSGSILSSSGAPVPDATIVATHVPTGTVYRTTSGRDGHYEITNMLVGGPYEFKATAGDHVTAERKGVTTVLGQAIAVDLVARDADVVLLETYVVKAASNELNPSETGAGLVMSSQMLGDKPTTARSLNEMISATPTVTLRLTSGDREENSITALGTNNRFNSIMIDGARINDQFGLNASGSLSFFNPLSLDTVEQLSVQVAPYDVKYSGFTGAAINAVTKSGTNDFHGTAYYMFSGDHLAGMRFQGPDVAPGPTQGKVPPLETETWGATFGGPIIKNKLFFFLNYEDFKRINAPSSPGLTPTAADLAALDSRFAAINTALNEHFDFGTFSPSQTNKAEDTKKLAKIDWNISESQRLSVRYSDVKGNVPLFGSFSLTSMGGVSLSGAGTTALTSNFYSQVREEETIAAQLFSRWTSNFSTEIKYAHTLQDATTPTASTLPQINIFGVHGLDRSNNSISNGSVILGTDQFRQGNIATVKTDSYSATGDYTHGQYVFSGGFDREESSFYNLFRAGSYGVFDFASIADFQNDVVAAFSRSYYVQGTPAADVSEFAVTGIFSQVKWTPNPRLTVTGGLRYDYMESGIAPPLNTLFLSHFGRRNDGTVDGSDSISPRISVNYAIDKDRTWQLRAGLGHFVGRAPWVFFSNSYANSGVGRYSDLTLPGGLVPYLDTQFDPANPVGVSSSTPSTGRFEVDYVDDKLNLPSVWRGNVSVDRRLSFLDSVVTLDYIQTRNDEDLFITNDNLKPTTIGADGRQRFAGNPSTAANALDPAFTNIYHISNASAGKSRYISLIWDRPMKGNWAANVSYTNGYAINAQPNAGTSSSGVWAANPVFNQNTVEPAHSEFEIKHRVQASASYRFELVKRSPTVVSIYYEGRSGNPYSFTYSNDLNGDGRTGNDLIAVPTDASDSRFNFSGMSQVDRDAYFAFIRGNGIDKYAGGYAPRDAFTQPWINRLDLHVSQNIPVRGPVDLELFFDFVNFGSLISKSLFNYYEIAPQNSSETTWRRFAGSATYGSDGRIIPTFSGTAVNPSSNFILDNVQSRWRLQIGARLKF